MFNNVKETKCVIDGIEIYTRNPNREFSTASKRMKIYFVSLVILLSFFWLALEITQYQVSQSQVRHFQYLAYKH